MGENLILEYDMESENKFTDRIKIMERKIYKLEKGNAGNDFCQYIKSWITVTYQKVSIWQKRVRQEILKRKLLERKIYKLEKKNTLGGIGFKQKIIHYK